jgi:hypothetical protein
VFLDEAGVGCPVDAIDFVIRDEAVDPLDFGSKLAKHGESFE